MFLERRASAPGSAIRAASRKTAGTPAVFDVYEVSGPEDLTEKLIEARAGSSHERRAARQDHPFHVSIHETTLGLRPSKRNLTNAPDWIRTSDLRFVGWELATD